MEQFKYQPKFKIHDVVIDKTDYRNEHTIMYIYSGNYFYTSLEGNKLHAHHMEFQPFDETHVLKENK